MDVIFEIQRDRRQFTIEIGYFDTILEIKEKVLKYQGISVSNQTLFFNGQVLQDEGDVASCSIFHNSHIQLSEKDIKIEELDPINRLVMQSELQNDCNLREHELIDNDVNNVARPPLSMISRGSKNLKLKVLINTSCGSLKISVDVNPSDNVGELRNELEKMQTRMNLELPLEGYFFICNQNIIEENRSFRWNRVGQGDTIEIFNGSISGGP